MFYQRDMSDKLRKQHNNLLYVTYYKAIFKYSLIHLVSFNRKKTPSAMIKSENSEKI